MLTDDCPDKTLSADFQWLLEHANEFLSAEDTSDVTSQSLKLQKRHGKERGRLLCELTSLRKRGVRKFSRGNQMFFTRRALEQATDEQIASYKAQRFRKLSSVVDLCSGIGGDALGMATTTATTHITMVDRAPDLCAFAAANMGVYNVAETRFRILCSDAWAIPLSPFEAWHFDPDRRPDGHRRTNNEACDPPLADLLRRPGLPTKGAIKLAPSSHARHLLEQGVELEWVGHHGECQQLVAWFGELARAPGEHVCTLLMNGESISAHGLPQRAPELAASELRYLYEPTSAALASGLANSLAAEHSLRRLATDVVYFAGDTLLENKLLTSFEVVDAMPFRRKTVKQALSSLDLRLIEVKRRMVHINPEQLLRELRCEGTTPAVLLLYPRNKSIRAVLAKRI